MACRTGAPTSSRDRRQLGGSVGGGLVVSHRQHDLDARTQQPCPRHTVARFLEQTPDHRTRSTDVTLHQPQTRQPRLWHAAVATRLAVRRFGVGGFTAKPMEFAELVEGQTDGRLTGGIGQAVTRPLRLLHGLGPVSVPLHDL